MRNKSLFTIFVTVFIDLVGFGIIIPLHPYLARDFGASEFDVGILMAIYSAFQFLFAPIWGRVSDRFGRRPIILMSLLGASVSHLAFGFAGSFTLLLVARGFAGLFSANISTAMAYIADVTSKEERTKGMGIIGAAIGLGFTVGPFIGAFFMQLGQHFGDAPPFGSSFAAIVAGAICLANFILAYFSLKESLSPSQRQRPAQRTSRFLLLARHVKRPTVGILICVYGLYSLAMSNMEAPLFMVVQDRFGWGEHTASLGFAYMGIVLVFTQGFLVRKFQPVFGERWILTIGIILSALGYLAIGFSWKLWWMVPSVTVMALGLGLISPAVTGSISLLTGPKEQGETMGVNQSLAALARIFGPLLGGWLYYKMDSTQPFVASFLFMILALILLFSILEKVPSQTDQDLNDAGK